MDGFIGNGPGPYSVRAGRAGVLPAEHQFGVFAVHMFLHQLQQECSHDVRVVLQLPMQGHCQQRGEVHLISGIKLLPALQGTDELWNSQRK